MLWKATCAEQHDLVISQQRPDGSPSGACLVLQAHDKLYDADPIRAPIAKISGKPERAGTGRPLQIVIDKTGSTEQGAYFVELPMGVTDYIQRVHSHGSMANQAYNLSTSGLRRNISYSVRLRPVRTRRFLYARARG